MIIMMDGVASFGLRCMMLFAALVSSFLEYIVTIALIYIGRIGFGITESFIAISELSSKIIDFLCP